MAEEWMIWGHWLRSRSISTTGSTSEPWNDVTIPKPLGKQATLQDTTTDAAIVIGMSAAPSSSSTGASGDVEMGGGEDIVISVWVLIKWRAFQGLKVEGQIQILRLVRGWKSSVAVEVQSAHEWGESTKSRLSGFYAFGRMSCLHACFNYVAALLNLYFQDKEFCCIYIYWHMFTRFILIILLNIYWIFHLWAILDSLMLNVNIQCYMINQSCFLDVL